MLKVHEFTDLLLNINFEVNEFEGTVKKIGSSFMSET